MILYFLSTCFGLFVVDFFIGLGFDLAVFPFFLSIISISSFTMIDLEFFILDGIWSYYSYMSYLKLTPIFTGFFSL